MSGRAQAQNVHLRDRTRLARDGFAQYRLEWAPSGGATREATVYAQRLPALKELRDAADALFGAMGDGSVRLLDPAGIVLLGG